MKVSKNSLVMAAAFAGLVGGTAVRAAQPLQSASSWTAGLTADSAADKKKIEKHACKGMNSCKGQGGWFQEGDGQERVQGQGRLRHRRLQAQNVGHFRRGAA